jgi:soluble lytic murein transglycosylase-like protein
LNIKQILASVLFLLSAFSVQADTLSAYINTLHEQEIVKEWVASHATVELSEDQTEEIVRHAYAHATTYSFSPLFVLALMRVESGFNAKAVSNHGAKGLLQVLARVHKKELNGRNPLSAQVSLEVGSAILDDCMTRNQRVVYKALNCYSGGGGKKYYKEVKKHWSDLMNFVKQNSSSPTMFAMK